MLKLAAMPPGRRSLICFSYNLLFRTSVRVYRTLLVWACRSAPTPVSIVSQSREVLREFLVSASALAPPPIHRAALHNEPLSDGAEGRKEGSEGGVKFQLLSKYGAFRNICQVVSLLDSTGSGLPELCLLIKL